jgi:hypothetical protein
MAHPRALIRQAAVAQLIAASTAAGSRVEATREIPYRRSNEPAIGVYTPDEATDTDTRTAPRELTRDLRLVIEAVIVGVGGVDDALDDLAGQIEAAIDADDTLSGTAAETKSPQTETEVMEESGKRVGLLRITYTATYYTFAPLTVSAPDAFLSASLKHNLNGEVNPADQAEDIVEPEQ